MKAAITAFAVLTATATTFATGVANASPYEFELRNATGQYIVAFYAKNVDDRIFGPDLLDTEMIRPGHSIVIDPDDGSGHCRYDLRTVMESGLTLNRWNVNVCALTRYTIGK
ncbi:hypothetical protein [Cupriavidus sp. CuC1]|uniref:hypothetical protein n=1 Tax=Cupriavidus sp. CuC1 TaxID=3373131 RepID=UPI0037D8462B